MTEDEYITITDLTRIRAAQDLLAGVNLDKLVGALSSQTIYRLLNHATEQLENKIQDTITE